MQNPEVTSRIRKIFNSQEGLTGLVKQLPLDQRFQLMNVKAVSVGSAVCHCMCPSTANPDAQKICNFDASS
jgi:hypothetical protein